MKAETSHLMRGSGPQLSGLALIGGWQDGERGQKQHYQFHPFLKPEDGLQVKVNYHFTLHKTQCSLQTRENSITTSLSLFGLRSKTISPEGT
jgi:hypothetical protein